MGKVLAIGGVLPKLQAAIDGGCAEVIMPKENERRCADGAGLRTEQDQGMLRVLDRRSSGRGDSKCVMKNAWKRCVRVVLLR